MDHATRRLDATDPLLPPPQRPCYECGGPMIEAGLTSYRDVQLYRRGTLGLASEASKVQTLVCRTCGAVRLYALQPANLVPPSIR